MQFLLQLPAILSVLGFLAGPGEAAGPLLTLEEHERRYIVSVLEQTGWTIKGDQGAAKILDLPPSTLTSRMKKLGIARRPR